MPSRWSAEQAAHLEKLRSVLLRHRKKWQDIADHAGVTKRTIQGFVHRSETQSNPCVHTLQSIADALVEVVEPPKERPHRGGWPTRERFPSFYETGDIPQPPIETGSWRRWAPEFPEGVPLIK